MKPTGYEHEGQAAVELMAVSAGYGRRVVTSNITVTLEPGTMTALIGGNGAGKTTLLNTLAGIQSPLAGQIRFCGEDLNTYSVAERAKQIASLGSPTELSATAIDGKTRILQGLWPARESMNQSPEQALAKVMDELELSRDDLEAPLNVLSTGQQKRIHLARALIHPFAQVFVFDEVLASLDAHHRNLALNAIRARCETGALAVVGIHHMDALNQFDQVLGIANGQIDIPLCAPTTLTPERLLKLLTQA